MTTIEFADKYLGEYKIKGKELQIKKCPFCQREKSKFYLNSETGLFRCFSGSCDEKGTILKLKHKFGINVKFKETISNKVQTEKVLNLTSEEQKEFKPLTYELYKWWKKRKISKETLDYMKVCSRKNAIVFPYLQNYELKMIKYRTARIGKEKKVWQQEGGIPVLWGLDKIQPNKPVILTEGEPDMLSWIEAGFNNVVSVPFGTSNTEWIENNLKELKQIKELYICFDKDTAGEKAEVNIKARLSGMMKLKKINLGTYNDVNEVLVKDGKEKLEQFYDTAEDYKVDGYYYANDIQIETTIPETTGFIKELDKATGGFRFSEVVVWSAYTGCGKTTFLAQLSLSSILQGYNVCYYTGEDSKEDLLGKIALQLYGSNGVNSIYNPITGENELYPTKKAAEDIKKHINNKMIILEDEVILNNKELLEKIQNALTNDNCRIFFIDNLMQIDILKEQNENKNDIQKKFVRDLVRFARKNNIQIHLVAHNKKPEGKSYSGKTYDVSGASEIVNLAHMVLGIDKINKDKKEELKMQGIDADALVNVLKKRKRQGTGGNSILQFDNEYQLFYFDKKPNYLVELNKKSKKDVVEYSKEEVDELFDIKPDIKETVTEISDIFEGEVIN